MVKKKVIIIGAGPANLIAATLLSISHEVHIFEKGKRIGRKFLVAGNGGFNLSHNVEGEDLLSHYSQQKILGKALESFGSRATRNWLEELGIPTYVGSSGRIFPIKGIKPIQVLQKIKDRLDVQGVKFHFYHEFIAFTNDGIPRFRTHPDNIEIEVSGDFYIFGLGGASWSKTGSDGKWLDAFQKLGVETVPFQASNCGININWPDKFREQFHGSPLKNIRISLGTFSIKGEALITHYGLEGNAIYPCIPQARALLSSPSRKHLSMDLKPHNSKEQLLAKIKGKSIRTKNYGYIFHLSKMQLSLIKNFTTKEEFLNPITYINSIKNLNIPFQSLRDMEEAISTVGGIEMGEINIDFSLKRHPNIYIVGEMLDWDAPTGGFLLQGCFATGFTAARAIRNIR